MKHLCRSLALLVAIALLTACGPSTRSLDRAEVIAPRPLLATVGILAGEGFDGRQAGSPGGERAQAYLVNAFRRIGLEPAFSGSYRQRMRVGANIAGIFRGEGANADEVVLVGAHFDHLGRKQGVLFPGANDNASGVAAMIAIARWWAVSAPSDRRTVIFVAFDAEEAGLLGSKHFASNLPVPRHRIVAAVVADMLGTRSHEGFGDNISVLGTEKSPELAAIAVETTAETPELGVARIGLHVIEQLPFQRRVWSDYGPLRDLGIPSVFVSSGLSPTYHQPTDTPQTLAPTQLSAATSWLEAFVRRVATLPVRPTWDAGREDLQEDLRQIHGLVVRSLDPETHFLNPLVRPAKLRAHLQALEATRTRVGAAGPVTPADVSEIRRAALRLACYAGGPESPFSSLCNAF